PRPRARSAREALDPSRTVPKTGEVSVRRETAPSPRPERRRRRWGAQRSPRQRLAFDVVAGLVLGALVSAWAFSIVAAYRERGQPPGPGLAATPPRPGPPDPPDAPASVGRTIGASLTDPRASSTAYLSD